MFFQAEDGIRDLVRSRGLGDVYKRQPLNNGFAGASTNATANPLFNGVGNTNMLASGAQPVSYTHLTLPTSDLV